MAKLGGIKQNSNRSFHVWVLTPIGNSKEIVSNGLSKDETEEALADALAFRERKCLHLQEVRDKLHSIDTANNVGLREFSPIISA